MRSLGAGVTGYCELLYFDPGIQIPDLCKHALLIMESTLHPCKCYFLSFIVHTEMFILLVFINAYLRVKGMKLTILILSLSQML